MRHMYVGLAAIVVSVGVVSAASQGRNFSGTWTVDMQKTMEARQSGGGAGMIVASGAGGGMAAGGVMTGGGGMGSGGGGAVAARSGGAGGAMADTVITLTATTFTIEVGETITAYPINGTEITVPARNVSAHAKAVWEGDTIVITTTIDLPNGPTTATAKWALEGDSLVRETGSKLYYKRK